MQTVWSIKTAGRTEALWVEMNSSNAPLVILSEIEGPRRTLNPVIPQDHNI
jgi:hypothetical protein